MVAKTTGVVTTLAGSTAYTSSGNYFFGSEDGTGLSALFRSPAGITTDGINLCVADKRNFKIRKIAAINDGTAGPAANEGQVAIWTRNYGSPYVSIDGQSVGSVTARSTPPTCAGGSGSIVKSLVAGGHSITANYPSLSFVPDNIAITAGGCLVYELIGKEIVTTGCQPGGAIACTCPYPQVLQWGVCVTPAPTCTYPQVLQGGVCVTPTPTCTSPEVLQNGVCVTPGTGTGGSGTGGGMAGNFIGTGSGTNAAGCLSFGFLESPYEGHDSQTFINNCSFPVYYMYCHTLSTLPGTADTQCNAAGSNRFYQQFSWLQPGEVKSNFYSLPPETTIWYGACSGGNLPSGKAVSLTGDYVCD
jgi:hypothetical protein